MHREFKKVKKQRESSIKCIFHVIFFLHNEVEMKEGDFSFFPFPAVQSRRSVSGPPTFLYMFLITGGGGAAAASASFLSFKYFNEDEEIKFGSRGPRTSGCPTAATSKY